MNRIWQQLAIATNWPILAAVAVLSVLGVMSIWIGPSDDGPKQLVFLAVAVAVMAALQTVNYLHLGRYAWPLYFLSLILIGYTLLGGFAEEHGHSIPGVHSINGACCWITFPGGVSFEPSELMKISFILVLARYLRYRDNYRTMSGLLPPFLLTLVPAILILKQPDLGVAALFIPTLFTLLFVAGAKVKHLLAIVGLAMVLIPLLWFSGDENVPIFSHLPSIIQTYQRARVAGLLSRDPKTLRQSGFQQLRALTAMGSGGPTGKGAGEIPVGEHVPEARNDMIFAIIGEQFGLVGSIAVLMAYIVLFIAGIEIASATREPFGRLVAIGIVALLAAQAILNLSVVMRLFPVTGVTLPFVSYGGSSLVASYIAAGFLLNIGQNRPLVIARNSFEYD
ncbi:MAG TPA: FtsW/RodA/SpoVE family cell cycle protein [Tepidisphaeraceae bacterium]|jgi:cell division protein FtsW (lipid II flippase)|nr:FtsW/RodA/SpoVE family cell cycle protein [Tepidisphaeraceae bacterium]